MTASGVPARAAATESRFRHRGTATIVTIFVVAFALRFGVARALPNILWPDEIFQSLEQAHRLVFHYGLVLWEFREGARSWLLPGLLAPVMKLTAPLGAGSSGYLAGAQAWLCLLSLGVPYASYRLARGAGLHAAIVATLATSLWFELVYFAPKALAEVVATYALAPALALLDEEGAEGSGDDEGALRRRLLLSGMLLGLATALRPHLAPAVLVASLVALRARWRLARGFAIALALPLLAAGALDFATWGAPFHSYAHNVRANVIAGKAATYGTAPPYAYASLLWGSWSFATPMVLALAALGARRAKATASAAVTVLVVHAAIAHKEWRFVVPAIALTVVLASIGLLDASVWLARRPGARRLGSTWVAALGLAGWLAVSAERADTFDLARVSLPRGLSGEPTAAFRHLRGSLLAFAALSSDDRICGVGLENRRWNLTGGYTWLHRNVPIFEIRSNEAFAQRAPSFNALVVRVHGPAAVGSYVREACWDEACVYVRPGGCAPAPDYDINERLRAVGE